MSNYSLIYFLIILLCIEIFNGCSPNLCQNSEEILYTTQNIWYGKRINALDALNYKSGDILPAGSRVKFIKCGTRDRARAGLFIDKLPLYYIDFKPLDKQFDRNFRIYLNTASYPKVTIQDFKDRLFSKKDFKSLVSEFSELEIKAIKDGTIVPGMRKDAVLVSFGYPSGRDTRNLNSIFWIYWEGISKKFIVEFDSLGLTISDINFNN